VQLFFIDIDNFKYINDEYGHDVGDMVLKNVTQRMLHCIRNNDMLVRLGGDEFIIIVVDETENNSTGMVAEKILASLVQPIKYNQNNLYTSASIGIAIYPIHAQSPEKLIVNADKAMYMAKKEGKNQYVVFQNNKDPVLS